MIYIVLLRGINVSGKNKILMKDFVSLLLEHPNIISAKSYIQGGNFVIESDVDSTHKINTLFTDVILKNYQYHITVFSYTLQDFTSIYNNNPFTIEDKKNYISFLADVATPLVFANIDDVYKIDKDIVYIKYKTKYSDSKLNNNFLEKQLKTIATTRNFNTIIKLIALATK